MRQCPTCKAKYYTAERLPFDPYDSADCRDAAARTAPDENVRQYLTTALWSAGESDDGTPMDAHATIADFHPDSVARAAEDWRRFMAEAGPMIEGRESDAAHDFSLTRNGHGAGFWDGDWPEHGDKLTAIAKRFGEIWVYVGDDGKLHFS